MVHPIKAILLIVLLVTITSSMILSMVQLTELNDQINQASAELSTQQSESVRLNLELNTAMSMNNVEDYAEKTLGLVKMEPSQVEYITLTKGNAIEIPQEQNAGFFETIQQAFHNFLEYLAG